MNFERTARSPRRARENDRNEHLDLELVGKPGEGSLDSSGRVRHIFGGEVGRGNQPVLLGELQTPPHPVPTRGQ